jgi:hypothetical protein
MALNVIGASFGRTGTRSQKTALEEVLKSTNCASVFARSHIGYVTVD